MKIREVFEPSEKKKGIDRKNPSSGVKKVSEIFEVMMRNERERKSNSENIKKKKRETKKGVKRLETKKTV